MGEVAKSRTFGIDPDMNSQKRAKDVMPNVDDPIISEAKLTEYLLNPNHPRGGDKARVYKAALGFEQEDAMMLADALRVGLASGAWIDRSATEYGTEHVVDIAITGKNGYVKIVRSRWVYDIGSDFPRLITAIVRNKKNE